MSVRQGGDRDGELDRDGMGNTIPVPSPVDLMGINLFLSNRKNSVPGKCTVLSLY